MVLLIRIGQQLLNIVAVIFSGENNNTKRYIDSLVKINSLMRII